MEPLDILKYAGATAAVIFAFYIILRIGSSAIFRSYFEAKKKN